MARLIEDLLDMSRIISGRIRLDMHTVELPLVVNSALEAASPRPRSSNPLERHIDPTAGRFAGMPAGCSRWSGTC